MVSTVSWVHHS